jgi:UDP-perosamine 4-acetyltransferase
LNSAVIVIGAGGHAKVVIEILRSTGYQIAYCVGGDDSPLFCLDVPVLQGDDHLVQLRSKGYTNAFPAIGSNSLRTKLCKHAITLGYEIVSAISPHSYVSPSATIGYGVAIMGGVVINAQSVVQDMCIINTGATVDHDCYIGYGVHIAPGSSLAGNVRVGDRAFLGIGTSAIPNSIIGEDSVIGAGGVVISNIPANVVAVGVPARIIKQKEL